MRPHVSFTAQLLPHLLLFTLFTLIWPLALFNEGFHNKFQTWFQAHPYIWGILRALFDFSFLFSLQKNSQLWYWRVQCVAFKLKSTFSSHLRSTSAWAAVRDVKHMSLSRLYKTIHLYRHVGPKRSIQRPSLRRSNTASCREIIETQRGCRQAFSEKLLSLGLLNRSLYFILALTWSQIWAHILTQEI